MTHQCKDILQAAVDIMTVDCRNWYYHLPCLQYELPLCLNHKQRKVPVIEARPFLVLPLTVMHIINEQSPLYNIVSNDLEDAQFEIIAVLEGVVESTGMLTQAKMSYLPHEIQWGHRFKTMNLIRGSGKQEKVNKLDFSALNKTYPVVTPKCSAKDYYNSRHSRKINTSRPNEHKIWIPIIEYQVKWTCYLLPAEQTFVQFPCWS